MARHPLGLGGGGRGTAHRAADRRDHPRHVDRDLRVRPAPLRGARALPAPGRRARPRDDGHRRGGRSARPASCAVATGSSCRSTSPAATAGCVAQLFAQCETTQIRDSARAPRCSATRRCTAPCRAARPSISASRRRTSGRSRSPTGRRRALPLPVRHPSHRLAGGRLRGRRPRRHPRRPRARPGRPAARADRPAPRRRSGDRRRPGAGAAGDRGRVRESRSLDMTSSRRRRRDAHRA